MTHSTVYTNQELYKAIQAAFKSWHRTTVSPGLLAKLSIYKRLEVQCANSDEKVLHCLLSKAMEHLEIDFPKDVQLLRRRYLQREPVHQISSELGWADSSLYRKQHEAIQRLVEIISTLENKTHQDTSQNLSARLEVPTYTNLVGVQKHLDNLVEQLVGDGPPWIFALEGIGGIGKTTVADALARVLIDQKRITDIGWVTARESQFILGDGIRTIDTPLLSTNELLDALANQLIPELVSSGAGPTPITLDERLFELKQILKRIPHVVFIDNLETISEIRELLPQLRSVANPTKFVLTTRNIIHGAQDIFYYDVPELSLTDTLALVRQEGELGNLPHLSSASDADLLPIWKTVGGNPLAIRLISGQTRVHSLSNVLNELQHAKGEKAEQFYTFIYSQAWSNLDEQTRRVFLAMPLLTDQGGSIERLSSITELDSAGVAHSLDRLVSLNLVDSRGGLNERLYTIHNLTRTFLREQVAKWR